MKHDNFSYFHWLNTSLAWNLDKVFDPPNISDGEGRQLNSTDDYFSHNDSVQFIFDRIEIQALLIILYVSVFLTGFVGNLLVLVVMWLHPRMRSSTNFFLTNLAVADFCVTIFCVLQNLSLYLSESWIFGNLFCKLYHYFNSLSYTSSVIILVVNCIERYIAIMNPFRAKIILSHRNLTIVLLAVWIASGIYCFPRLLYFRTVYHFLSTNNTEIICVADRVMFNSKTFDTISFLLLYLTPLAVISILYTRIARFLWVNNIQQENTIRRHALESLPSTNSNKMSISGTSLRIHRGKSHSENSRDFENHDMTTRELPCRKSINESMVPLRYHRGPSGHLRGGNTDMRNITHTCNSRDIIRRWQKVVKLLLGVVVCFAVCNLPYHVRKMLIYYYSGYKATSNGALIATPITQVLTYLNSAMNPVLYCFMSDNFRLCIRDIMTYQYTWKRRRTTRGIVQGTRPLPSCQTVQMEMVSVNKEKHIELNLSRVDKF